MLFCAWVSMRCSERWFWQLLNNRQHIVLHTQLLLSGPDNLSEDVLFHNSYTMYAFKKPSLPKKIVLWLTNLSNMHTYIHSMGCFHQKYAMYIYIYFHSVIWDGKLCLKCNKTNYAFLLSQFDHTLCSYFTDNCLPKCAVVSSSSFQCLRPPSGWIQGTTLVSLDLVEICK